MSNSFSNANPPNNLMDQQMQSNYISAALWPVNTQKLPNSQTRTISPTQTRHATEDTSRGGRRGGGQPIGNLKDINDVHAIYQQIKNGKKGSVDVRSLMRSQGGQR